MLSKIAFVVTMCQAKTIDSLKETEKMKRAYHLGLNVHPLEPLVKPRPLIKKFEP